MDFFLRIFFGKICRRMRKKLYLCNYVFMARKEHIYDYGTLFKGVSREEKRMLAAAESERCFAKGKVIYKEGGRPSELYCLLEGRVKIYREGMDRRQTMRLVRTGECFGYRPYMLHQKYAMTAETMSEVKVVCVKMCEVRRLMARNPKVAMNFVRDLSAQLGQTDGRLVSLTQKHIRGRMADALLMMLDTYGRELNTGLLACQMSREEIANLANMTTANGIRTLAAFNDEGVVELQGKRIKIMNEMQLRKISALG